MINLATLALHTSVIWPFSPRLLGMSSPWKSTTEQQLHLRGNAVKQSRKAQGHRPCHTGFSYMNITKEFIKTNNNKNPVIYIYICIIYTYTLIYIYLYTIYIYIHVCKHRNNSILRNWDGGSSKKRLPPEVLERGGAHLWVGREKYKVAGVLGHGRSRLFLCFKGNQQEARG